jgi:hypothetical protein
MSCEPYSDTAGVDIAVGEIDLLSVSMVAFVDLGGRLIVSLVETFRVARKLRY